MSSFNEREEAFEKKFALEEEHKFQAEALRIKHLGLWAAGKLGKAGDEANAYATSIVVAEVDGGGREAVIRKLAADLAAAGISDLQIRRKLEELSKESGGEA